MDKSNLRKVKKAIIPAAGFGTRFLPQTKAMPKEMLPVVDKPVIQYVVEECVSSGIEDIIIVTGYHKRSIEDHFDHNPDLEYHLEVQGKTPMLKNVREIADCANFIYIRQKGGYGNGTPVLNARRVIGNEPFAVLWGDEFIYSNPPRLRQCLEVFEKYGDPVISGIKVPKKDVSRYGIAEVKTIENNVHQIFSLLEKPKPSQTPSNLATHGCYVLTPDIFDDLAQLEPGRSDEIWLVDAIKQLMKRRPVYACEIKEGKYYDTGNKVEYLKAVVEFALDHQDVNGEFRKFLKNLKV